MHPTLGFIATIIIAAGYVPQIVHILRGRCAAAVSIHSWVMWTFATILLFIHAITGPDIVFKVFTSMSLFLCTITLTLVFVYRKNSCKTNFKKKRS